MKRWTNLALFVLLGLAFVTGWVAFFYSTAPSRASLIVHAVSGYAIVALTPWKAVIAAHGIQRRRPGWWASLVFTCLVIASVLAGILHSTGLLVFVGPFSAMEVHVGAALAAIPFVAWHVIARRIPMRAVDLSRRSLLRASTLAASAGLVYGAGEVAVRLLSLPGATRRFTGSYEYGSLQPAQLPVTQWLFDSVPSIDPATWRLTVQAANAMRQWTYAELVAFDDRVQATLDCTGGFYSTQDWSGVWLSRLLSPSPHAAESRVATESPSPARGGGQGGGSSISVHVRSLTGYDRRFAVREAGRLLIATRLGGMPLDPGHGFPVRIVAPDWRGYWWVKWVTAITIDELPSWWQLPFPIQ
jgi:DMSO/TMAO reductase YedYZ molybdopterin-dependent catalytic subunit